MSQEEPNKAVLEILLKNEDEESSDHEGKSSKALKAAKKKLRVLQREIENQPEDKISTKQLTQFAELKMKIKELESAENQKVAQSQSSERPSFREAITNIWVLRSLILVSGIVAASLLLAYSFIFVNHYVAMGESTSYFPWAWGIDYADAGSIQNLFLGAFTASTIAIAGCAVTLYFVIPELRFAIRRR
jgi:hypothetical protein